jgi:tetratricopeptide (TPR) repeat protein
MLQQGIAAAKAGKKDKAREILQNVLAQDPKNETAWWWLASVLDKEDAIICLKNVLKLNPGNKEAQAALAKLQSGKATAPKPVEPRQKPSQQVKPQDQITEYSYSSRHRREEILAWLEYAEVLHKEGQTRQQIEASLKQRGVNQEDIRIVLKKLLELHKKVGLKKMYQGGTGCLGGLVVVIVWFLFFYTMTGHIVIARSILFISGGVMFLSIVLFLGGLIQYISTWGPD